MGAPTNTHDAPTPGAPPAAERRRGDLLLELIDFVDHELIPAEPVFVASVPACERHAVLAALRAEARRRGLLLTAAQRSTLGSELSRCWLAAAVCRAPER